MQPSDVMYICIRHKKLAYLSSSLVLVPFSAAGCSIVSLVMPFICGQRIAEIRLIQGLMGDTVVLFDPCTDELILLSADQTRPPPATHRLQAAQPSLNPSPIHQVTCAETALASYSRQIDRFLFCMEINMKCHLQPLFGA